MNTAPLDAAEPGAPSPARFGGWLAAAVAGLIALLGAVGLTAAPAGETRGGSRAEVAIDPTAVIVGFGDGLPGTEWSAVAGAWTVADGVARLVEPPGRPGAPGIAVADLGSPDGWVAATAAEMTSGWGLVFRYADLANFSYVIADPVFASFRIVEVAAGTKEVLGSVAPAPTRAGALVRVDASGSDIRLTVDGQVLLDVASQRSSVGDGIGLYAAPSAAGSAGWGAVQAGREAG